VTFRGLGVLKGDIGCLEDFLLDLDLVERFLSGVVGFSASMSCDQIRWGCYESRASGLLTVPLSVLSPLATFTQGSEHLYSCLPSSWDRSELQSVDIAAGDTHRLPTCFVFEVVYERSSIGSRVPRMQIYFHRMYNLLPIIEED
jgi:hypothetical protein